MLRYVQTYVCKHERMQGDYRGQTRARGNCMCINGDLHPLTGLDTSWHSALGTLRSFWWAPAKSPGDTDDMRLIIVVGHDGYGTRHTEVTRHHVAQRAVQLRAWHQLNSWKSKFQIGWIIIHLEIFMGCCRPDSALFGHTAVRLEQARKKERESPC